MSSGFCHSYFSSNSYLRVDGHSLSSPESITSRCCNQSNLVLPSSYKGGRSHFNGDSDALASTYHSLSSCDSHNEARGSLNRKMKYFPNEVLSSVSTEGILPSFGMEHSRSLEETTRKPLKKPGVNDPPPR